MTNRNNRRLPINAFMQKAVRIMLTMISILLACVFILVGILQLLSHGKPPPFVDENGSPLAGSIAEKVFVNINGVEQGMFIMSKDTTHPGCFTFMGGCQITFLRRNTLQVWRTISPLFGGVSNGGKSQ